MSNFEPLSHFGSKNLSELLDWVFVNIVYILSYYYLLSPGLINDDKKIIEAIDDLLREFDVNSEVGFDETVKLILHLLIKGKLKVLFMNVNSYSRVQQIFTDRRFKNLGFITPDEAQVLIKELFILSLDMP